MGVGLVGFQGGEDCLAHMRRFHPSVPVLGFVEVHALLEKFKGESCFEDLQNGGIVLFV
jgi:hypothetical protein